MEFRILGPVEVWEDGQPISLGGAIWVANSGDDSLSRVDPRTDSVTKAISVGGEPVAVAVGEGSVWVVNGADDSMSRIDPRTNEVARTIPVEHRPDGVAIAGGLVWVTVRGER